MIEKFCSFQLPYEELDILEAGDKFRKEAGEHSSIFYA
jgi:hypothetical protein